MNLPRPRTNASVLIALAAIVAFALDQWSKGWITNSIHFDARCSPRCGQIVLIPDWLRFSLIHNTHGAFGMFGSNKPLLVVLACTVLVVFCWAFREAATRSRLVCAAIGIIAGGALGNIVDRLHYGYVIDFVDIYRAPQIWSATFNVGDFCITSGVALLLIYSLLRVGPTDPQRLGHLKK